jgi:hypothetical protein
MNVPWFTTRNEGDMFDQLMYWSSKIFRFPNKELYQCSDWKQHLLSEPNKLWTAPSVRTQQTVNSTFCQNPTNCEQHLLSEPNKLWTAPSVRPQQTVNSTFCQNPTNCEQHLLSDPNKLSTSLYPHHAWSQKQIQQHHVSSTAIKCCTADIWSNCNGEYFYLSTSFVEVVLLFVLWLL